MIISKDETKSALSAPATPATAQVDDAIIKLMDGELIKDVVGKLEEMPDREALVAEMKAKIEAGTYAHSGEELADAMARRALADRIR